MKKIPFLSSAIQCTAACAVLSLTLCSCANRVFEPDPRSPEQVVAQTSGRSMAATDTVTPGSGFGLDGFAYALAPITNKCREQQGVLMTGTKRAVVFQDRRRQLAPRSLSLTEIIVCTVASTPVWAANVEVQQPEYLVAQSFGTGINYYGEVAATFVAGETVLANRAKAEAARRREVESRQAERSECQRRREEFGKSVRADPHVGMKVAFGLIVDLKPPLALIQYDAFGQTVKGRSQEWIQISTLGAGQDCPQ